jgi:hypothetical protein
LVLALDAGSPKNYNLTAVEVLVVAGGGGGGMDMGGGGGGGGVIYSSSVSVTPGSAVSVTVGAGGYGAPGGSGGYRTDGAGPQPGGHQFTISATNGGNSVFGALTAIGGGAGGSSYFQYSPGAAGSAGGSGGGASGYSDGGTRQGGTGTVGQGYNGGRGGGQYYSGGGGGAGGTGVSGPNQPNGGPGVIYPSMSPYYFGGGGGGASYSLSTGGNGGIGGGGGGALGTTSGGAGLNNGSPGGGGGPNQWANTPGGNAGANTGGGGGGGSHYNANNKGGEGGSGIVIVRYQGPQKAIGGTVTSNNGYTIHTFTTVETTTFTPLVATNNSAILGLSDFSGNNNFGTAVNGPTYSSANFGSLVFDGVNDYVTTSLVTSLSNNVTISSWFKTFNASQAGQMVIHNGSDANGNGYGFAVNNEATTSGEILLLYSAIAWINTGFFATSNVIYNATMVIESDNSNKLYINGNLVHSGIPRTINTPTNHTEIGRNNYPAARYFNGNIAQVSIYNRALTAAEIQQNYNALKSRYI